MNERTESRAGGAGEQPPGVDAVRDGGPEALDEYLGRHLHRLRGLALDPGELFTVDRAVGPEHASGAYAGVVETLYELRCAVDALDARAMVALAEATTHERFEKTCDLAGHEDDATPADAALRRDADRMARQSLAMTTRRSPAAASRSLASSRRLVTSMPGMLAALAEGRVDPAEASASARVAAPLDPDERREYDRLLTEMLPDLDGAGRDRWNQARKHLIHRLAPDKADIRHQRERRKRHVTVHEGEHGMATVSAYLPALDAKLIHKSLSLDAERRRAEGDRRGHHAIMADALVGTLLGNDERTEPVTLDIGIIITDRALFDPGRGEAAHIEGYGHVPAELVREQLRASLEDPAQDEDDPLGRDGPEIRATFRRLFTHPTTGELVAMESRSRAFPAAMARFLRWRDTRCRGPFCNAVIRQSDHIRPSSEGGATSIDNGQGLCVHCNAKEIHSRSVIRVTGDADAATGHRVEWTSHAGTTRSTVPARFTAPTELPAVLSGTGTRAEAGAGESAGRADPETSRDEPGSAGPFPPPTSSCSELLETFDPLTLLRNPVALEAVQAAGVIHAAGSSDGEARDEDPAQGGLVDPYDEASAIPVPVPANLLARIEFANPGVPVDELPPDPLPADARLVRTWRFVSAA